MSSTKCVYHNCKNISRDISMFRFPVHDQDRLILWIQNSGNTYLDSLTNEELRCRYICAAHFPASSIQQGQIRSRLVGPAVPVHFRVEVGERTANQSEMDAENDVILSPEVFKVKTPTKTYRKRRRSPVPEEASASSPTVLYKELMDAPTPTARMSRKCLFEGPKRRLSRKCLFESNVDDTPKMKRLKTTASALLKKNRAQSSRIGRLQIKSKRNQSIETANFRTEFSKTIALMQLRKKNEKKKWTSEEKNVCLSLFYKSPATYNFLRRQGVVLASPSTIRMWLAKSNCLPGMCSDVFKNIEKRFEHAPIKEKACVICFDEMSIMSNLEYSKKYDLIEGFEDLGGNRRTKNIAKYCLVFLVRGLYAQWKLPVAYFLSNTNVKAENLELLIKALINKLFDSGVLPKAVVCDQASTNQKVFKTLGATSESPFFYSNDRKIFALFDVPHLIKNIRNNFLSNDYVHGDEKISFQDIKKTYAIDKASNVSRALTKLSERHINPNSFQKMSVSLATQIFSNSVAAAIRTAKATNELKSNTAEATAKFVQIVNHMFDALNSKNRYSKNPYKHALSKNSTYVTKAIIEAKNIFKNLQKISYKNNKDGQKQEILTRPPSFNGVVHTCEAVLQLFNEECSDPKITYIITRKLNQDVIENLFARFRQKGGSNRNPTAKLLRTIFRSNLVNSFIRLPTSKNCEDDDGEYIEPEKDNSVVTSNVAHSSPSSMVEANAIFSADSAEKRLYSADSAEKMAAASTSTTSTGTGKEVTLEECSLAYFAGYLAKFCLNNYKCETCTVNLLQDINLEDKNQILILNKAYDCSKAVNLKMPSNNLFRLVQLAIDCFNVHFNDNKHNKGIKQRLFNTVVNHVKCESPELLTISCENHLLCIIDHMILVKINFYCKSNKYSNLEHSISTRKVNPKLRILQNK